MIVTPSRNILVSLFSFAFGKQELEAKIEFKLSYNFNFFLTDLCGHGLPIVAFLKFTHLFQIPVEAERKRQSRSSGR